VALPTAPEILAGLVVGIAFGAIVQRTRFCTMGALADVLLLADGRRARAWLLAIAVALAGAQGLHLAGVIDLAPWRAPGPPLTWGGVILGGLAFGFGMTLTGGCVSRNLVRAGTGDLRALVVLVVLAMVALAMASGLHILLDDWLLPSAGRPPGAPLPEPLLALGAAAVLAWVCLKDRAFRRSRRDLLAGLAIGLLVTAGWLATALLAPRLGSLTFVVPLAQGLRAGAGVAPPSLGFALAACAGAVAGACAAALPARELRAQGFTGAEDLRRHLGGAVLMGAGGVLAGGCTVGQGIAGVATLAPASLLALAAIVLGGIAGIRYLEQGSLRGALRTLLSGG
jgi:uncharacterized protein